MTSENHITGTNPLLECAATVFSLTAPFRRDDRGSGLAEDYRDDIMAGFDELERMGFEGQIGMVILRDAKYALAAYVDETVLSSDWPGRLSWMRHPLQLEFFGDHLAGEGFFDRLNALRQGGEANRHLLELYYICMQLGFEGKFKLKGIEQLTALQVDVRSQIETYTGPVEPALSPEAVPRIGLMARARRELPYWVIGVATATAAFTAYVGFGAAISHITGTGIASMTEHAAAMTDHIPIPTPLPADTRRTP